ncbi:hypothetical protein [Clostridium tertium]
MENEIKEILNNIEKSNEEIKEMIIKTNIEFQQLNNELLNAITKAQMEVS